MSDLIERNLHIYVDSKTMSTRELADKYELKPATIRKIVKAQQAQRDSIKKQSRRQKSTLKGKGKGLLRNGS